MKVTNEISWAVLITRVEHFDLLRLKSDTVSLDVRHGVDLDVLRGPMNVNSFTFQRLVLNVSADVPVSLVLRFYLKVKESVYTEAVIPIKWNSYMAINRRTGLPVRVFPYDPKKIRLVLPKPDSPAVLVDMPLTGMIPGSKRNMIADPRRLANYLASIVRANSTFLRSPPGQSGEQVDTELAREVTETYVNSGNGIVSSNQASYIYWALHKTSVNTPGFGALKRKDWPVNPFRISRLKVTNSLGSLHRRVSVLPGPPPVTIDKRALTYPGIWSDTTGIPNFEFDTRAYSRAVARLAERSNANLDANIAQDLVQFRQLDNLIGGNINRVVRARVALGRGDVRGAGRILFHGDSTKVPSSLRKDLSRDSLALSRKWLELQYGWKPLLSDIEGAIRVFSTTVSRVNRTAFVVRSGAKVSNTTIAPARSPDAVLGHEFDIGLIANELSSKSNLGIKFRLSSQFQAAASQLGFLNPINLLWEIVPYSFVLDWAVPIGPYLETLSNFIGYEFLEGFDSRLVKRRTMVDLDYLGVHQVGLAQWDEFAYKGSYRAELMQLTRTRLTEFPSLSVSSIKPKNPFTFLHSLNALALLRTAFAQGGPKIVLPR